MRRIDKAIIVLIALWFASVLLPIFLTTHVTHALGLDDQLHLSNVAQLAGLLRSLIHNCVNIAVAAWLYRESRRAGIRPWVWALFGLLYGIIAAATFFVVRLYEQRTSEMSEQNHTANKHIEHTEVPRHDGCEKQ